jgi:hypothetical protein
MSTLTGRTIADSYKELLKTTSADGLSSALTTIEDGDATVSALSLSTTGISSSGTLTVSDSTSLNTLSVSGASNFTGSSTFGSLSSTSLTATMIGGTVNGTAIGGTSPSTGVFTQINVTGQGSLRLQEATGSGSDYIGLRAPTTVATSYTLTLPSANGSAGYALITDGSGNLSWQNPYGGGAVSLISSGDTSLAVVDTGTGSITGTVDGVNKFALNASGMSITGDLSVSGTFSGTATNANTLTTGRNFSITGDVTATAVSFNGSGNVALASTLASGVVNNTNVGASAAIAYSKLASLSTGQILAGNAGVPTATTVGGDATIGATGTVTIANNAINNAKVSTSAAIAFSKLGSLTTGQIVAGNAGVATATTLGGDATIGATGTLTIANDAITTAKILNANVTAAKVDTTSVAVLGTAQQYTRTHNFYLNTPLTDAATISWDASQNQVATVTLTATGRTLANPTNLASGAVYILIVKQNGTGNNTLSFGANYKWPSSATPTVTQTANSASILTFISDGTYMYGVSSLNYT